jgi:ABC-2 type transport system ATP-binding protein
VDVISVKNLSHTYPARRPAKTPRHALKGINFSVGESELFGLLGPNGGGKSTTFHILATFFPPTSGQALVFGIDVARHPEQVRQRLGVVFQSPSLDKKLTVFENLRHQGHLYGLAGRDLDIRIQEMLRRVALSDRARDLVEVLSGGLRRRVELAKGLLHRPSLLLLDEPTLGLDPGARKDLWDYLKELKQRENMTFVVTTHLMEEAERCDRVAILNEGELVALGTPTALKSEIGGDVITVETTDPAGLQRQLEQKFGAKVRVVEGALRIERERGHEFIPQLVSAFPGQITSVTLGKPTLEDVFIRHTGHRFWVQEKN